MPTSPYKPASVLPDVPITPISAAIEGAVRNQIADENWEAIGNLYRAGLIREEFLRDAFQHWEIDALYTTVYPANLMVHLYDHWFDIITTRGSLYSLDLFAAAVETTYTLAYTENARGRRVSVVVTVYPFATGAPTADQQLYLLAAYRWLFSTQVEVTAIRIVPRAEFPIFLAMPDRAISVAESL